MHGSFSGLPALAEVAAEAAHKTERAHHYTSPPVPAAAVDPAGSSAACGLAIQCLDRCETARSIGIETEQYIPMWHADAPRIAPSSVLASGRASVDILPDRPHSVAMMALESVGIRPDPPASLAMSGRASVNIPPDPSWHCSERYLATLLARCDALSSDELATLDALINGHLAATRPQEISVAFKYNVNPTYVWVSKGHGRAVGARQRRNQAAALTGLQGRITGARASACTSAHARILRNAQAADGLSVVPVCGAGRLPPQLQTLLTARCNISGQQWARLRESFGGRHRCFASREILRGASAAISKEPAQQVRTNERGAHLVDFHSALESVAAGLWSSVEWWNGLCATRRGAPCRTARHFCPASLVSPTLYTLIQPQINICASGLVRAGAAPPLPSWCLLWLTKSARRAVSTAS